MPFVTRKSLLALGVLSGLALAAITGFIWSGIYNIGADDAHTKPVYSRGAGKQDPSSANPEGRRADPAGRG
jgi:hypothetical protein